MDKREFLKASGLALTGTMLTPFASSQSPQSNDPMQRPANTRKNWSGNYTYSTDQLATPRNVEEVQAIVKRAKKLRALGTRHSFNAIADSTAEQISLSISTQMRSILRHVPLRSAPALPMANSHRTSTAMASRCIIWRRCRTSPSPAAAPRPRTAPAFTTEISPVPVSALELVTANGDRLCTLAREKSRHLRRRRCRAWRARHRHQPLARC